MSDKTPAEKIRERAERLAGSHRDCGFNNRCAFYFHQDCSCGQAERAEEIAGLIEDRDKEWCEALFPGNFDTTLGESVVANGPNFAAEILREASSFNKDAWRREALEEAAKSVESAISGHAAALTIRALAAKDPA